MEERADKSDLSWNEVLELIWEQTEKVSNINTTLINKIKCSCNQKWNTTN